MKRSMKRYLAMLLAMTLVLQQGGTITLADENEPASEVVTEKTTEAQAPEKKEEKKPEETKEPENKAPETKPEAPKTEEEKAPEIKPEETNAPDTQTETKNDETAAEPENGTEKATEQGTESEAVTGDSTTEGETQMPPEQEKESEKDSEPETKKEEEAKLDVSVMQEVFQKTVDDATVPMVRYTVKLANKAEEADLEDTTLKVLLADALSYKKEEGETPELISFETLGKAVEEAALESEELNEEQKTAYANGNVVLWKDQTIAAGAEKTFVFCAEVKDGQTDVNALKNLWLVNGEAVAEEKLRWENTELLEAERPSEFVYEGADGMIVTAVVSDPNAFPEGTVLVAEPIEVTEEDIAAAKAELEEGRQLARMLQYDIRFENDGQEIEPPEGVTVDVSIAYENAVELGVDPEASGLEMQVLHEKDNGEVEKVDADASISDDGAMDEVTFTADSFSPFMLMLTTREDEISLSLNGLKGHSAGEFYLCLLNKDDAKKQHIVIRVTVENGKISIKPNEEGISVEDNTIKISKMYNPDDGNLKKDESLTKGDKFKLEIFALKDTLQGENRAAILSQKHNEETSKRGSDNAFLRKEGDFLLSSGEKIVTIPEEVTVGNEERITLNSIATGSAASKSSVMADLGDAMKFGAFAWSYNQTADVESTIGAHTATVNGQHYNLWRQYKDIQNTILIQKHFEDEKGNGVSGKEITIRLYRVSGENKKLVAEMKQTTDNNGNATFLFNYENMNANSAGDAYIFGGTYCFCEVANGKELWESYDTFNIGEKTATVIYGDNYDNIVISNQGLENYSYFDDIEEAVLATARKGSYVVLGSPAWGKLSDKLTDDGTYNNQAYVVQAGEEGFPTISFEEYFGNSGNGLTGKLADASQEIARMKSGGDVVVYYVKADELYKEMNFTASDGKYIIVNVDTSGMEKVSLKQFKINGVSVSAGFGTEDGNNNDTSDTNILWNFYNYEDSTLYQNNVTNDEQVTGTWLAPAGKAYIGGGNLGGRAIAQSITGNQSEIHEMINASPDNPERSVDNVLGTVSNKSKTLAFAGTKAVENGNYGEDEGQKDGYRFKVELVAEDGAGGWKTATDENVTIAAGGVSVSREDGSFTTPNITFKSAAAAGTYCFKVSEAAGTDSKMEYDATWYLVEVTVENAEGTEPNVTSIVVKENGKDEGTDLTEKSSPYPLTEEDTFTNTRKHGKLEVTKTVTGTAAPLKTDNVKYMVTVTAKAGTSVDWTKVVEQNKKLVSTHELKKTDGGITFTFKADETVVLDGLPFGEYVVAEDALDSNGNTFSTTYEVDAEESPGEVKISDEDGESVTITNTYTDEKGSLKIKKVAVGAPADVLEDKTFEFTVQNVASKLYYNAEGEPNANEQVITLKAGSDLTIDDLPAGTYQVKEKTENAAIEGYSLVVSGGGSVTVEAEETADVTITNTYTQKKGALKIKKNVTVNGNPTTGTEADGVYKFEVKDAEGNKVGDTVELTVKNGSSVEETVSDLVPGKYTVSELTDGLKEGMSLTGSNDVEVTVTADTTTAVKTAEFTNNQVVVKVSIKKIDNTGKALAGAKLIIKDEDGNPVDSWTTDGEPHEITGLKKGTYTLSELEAPKGYQVSKDKTFKITGEEKNGAVIEVEMTDQPIVETKRSLRVTKELSAKDISPEAHIIVREATYYVALFTDEARTERVTDVKKIVFANQESSYATFDNLKKDVTYYVGETDEYGTLIPSGVLRPNLVYYPEYDGEATFKFEGETTEGLAGFTNVYVEWPDYLYLSGQLTVTKKVMLNGEPATSTDTFYARVFSDAGLTQPVSEILTLSMAGGSETSVLVTNLPIGNRPEDSRKYYVAETDANGTPLDPSAVTEYTVSVDKSEVTLSGSHASDTVVITNDFTEKESEFESEEIESESETEVAKQTAPKTGDDTDFMKYLLLMALSAGLGGIAVGQKRRKARRTRK